MDEQATTLLARIAVLEQVTVFILRAAARPQPDAEQWLQETANQLKGQTEAVALANGLSPQMRQAAIQAGEEFADLLLTGFRP